MASLSFFTVIAELVLTSLEVGWHSPALRSGDTAVVFESSVVIVMVLLIAPDWKPAWSVQGVCWF
jgi:hypothetical protein